MQHIWRNLDKYDVCIKIELSSIIKKRYIGGTYMIGERLARLRKAAGFTQEQLADLIGRSNYKSVSGYERDLNDPDDETKKIIAEKLNISLDYLLGLTDEEIKLDRSNNFALPDDFPETAKAELREYVELLIIKHKQKGVKK